MTSTGEVIAKAVDLVNAAPTGKRYSDLVREISAAFPAIPVNTVHGALHRFRTQLPVSVYQPSRGLYRAVRFREEGTTDPHAGGGAPPKEIKVREEDFYEAFGDWLMNEIEECTRYKSIGGNRFKDKWSTPDVIGVWEAKPSDMFRPPTEIISAEIKVNPSDLLTAFGQACSYKLFSHKSYIVVPDNSPAEDIARLDALSQIFGIGLIIFNPLDPKNPGFTIRARASRGDPDVFYMNKYMKMVEDDLFR